jgi:hypothetical protein
MLRTWHIRRLLCGQEASGCECKEGFVVPNEDQTLFWGLQFLNVYLALFIVVNKNL